MSRFALSVRWWFVLSVVALATVGAAAESIEGHWEGSIQVPGTKLELDVDFSRGDDGAWSGDITIPAQQLKDLPLVGITVDGNKVAFAIEGIPGDPKFDGTLSEDGATISGNFTQGGGTFPFSLTGAEKPAARARKALEGFDEVVEKALEDFDLPGMGLAIVVDDEVVHARGYGFRDVDAELPVDENTLFAIGSCSKAFTALMLGKLVDDGVVDWDKPVVDYLPDFRMYDDHATRNLTVRDLVCHRSGLPRHDALWYNATYTREELVERLRYLEPYADLREKYHYQNLMFLTAGYVIEQVTGKSWEQNVRETILDPLGMTRSNFSVEDSKKDDNHSEPYAERDDAIAKVPFRDITTVGPAGSINSSVQEMTSWLRLMLNGGQFEGNEVVKNSTAKEMMTPQMVTAGFPTNKDILMGAYGLGWGLQAYRGHYRAQHGGGIDGFIAMVTVLPMDGIGLVALSNRTGQGVPELVIRHAMDRLLELEPRDWLGEALEQQQKADEAEEETEGEAEKAARVEGTNPSHAIEDYAGKYEHPGYGLIDVELVDDALVATFNHIRNPLEHWHYDVFNAAEGADDPALEGTKFLFRTDVKGEIAELAVTMDPEVSDIIFTKQPDQRLFDPAFLDKLTGVYAFPNNDITIELRGSKLFASLPGQQFELEPMRNTEFGLKGLSGFSVIFVMGDDGMATEAQLHQPNGVFKGQRKQEE